MNFEQILHSVLNWLTTEGVKIVLGLLLMFVLFKVINIVCRKITKSLNKKNVDKTISHVVIITTRKALKVLIFICFLGYIGIETSSIAAAIASAGLALGLALQGSLSNFAGGVMILLMHPYKIGDYVEIGSEEGTVENVELFYTYLATNDNKVVIIPNSSASSGTIVNYSVKDTRRVDIVFQIAYENDFERAKQLVLQCAEETGYLVEGCAPFVRVSGHASSAIEITAKLWCKSENYWDLKYDMLEKVKKAFDDNGISIPYQQIDVHLPESRQ